MLSSKPSPLSLRCSSSDPFAYFHRIVLVAHGAVTSSCGVSVLIKEMSSAKRRLVRHSPSIFKPLFSQFNLLTMISSVAVNSLYLAVRAHLILFVLALMSVLLVEEAGQVGERGKMTNLH